MPDTQPRPSILVDRVASGALCLCRHAVAVLALLAAPAALAGGNTPQKLAQAATGAATAIAKPIPLPEREAAYVARMDKIVAPLLDYSPPAGESDKIGAAFKAISSGAVDKAKAIETSLADPLARRLVTWERLRRGKGEPAEYPKFLADNPGWPSREIQQRMEKTLPDDGGDRKTPKGAQKKGATDWSLVFHKIQKQRRTGKLEEAAKLLRSAPLDPVVVANLDDWWIERRGLAYLALKQKQPKLAYEIVRDAGPLSANALNDQTFMAGWIALRYLDDAKLAEKHFAGLVRTADGPLVRARANYWMGRTAEALGDADRARASYQRAARETDTFHGLLAAQKLNPGPKPLSFDPPAVAGSDQAERFVRNDAARAFALARKAGLGRGVTRPFLRSLAKIEKHEAWAAMAAHLARATGDTQTAVHIGKAAIAEGQNLVYYSYPIHALTSYAPLRPPPETAFLLGIARQETEFNSDTVSGPGARGILQVMKVTANHVCRDYKIKCKHDRLLTDDAYNIMIASAYIADRMDEWNGSYVLGLASYNAGPGRAREWVAEFGDPRDANVDPIDWIERIPFEETRRYVAKVLSNIQVYRARLGEKSALRLDEDLNRARVPSPDASGAVKAD